MTGWNEPCEFCGKMSDDYPDYNCCKEYEDHIELVRIRGDAQDEMQLKLEFLISDLLLQADSASEINKIAAVAMWSLKTIKQFHKIIKKIL